MAMGPGGGGEKSDAPGDASLDKVDGIAKDMMEEDAQARSLDSDLPVLLPAGYLQSYGKPVGGDKNDDDDDITGDDDDFMGDEKITTPPVPTDVSLTQPFFQSQAFAETAKQDSAPASSSGAGGPPGAGPPAAAAPDEGLKTPDHMGKVMDRMANMQNRMEARFVNNRVMVVDQLRNFEDRLTHVENRYCSSIEIQDEMSNLFQKYVTDQTNSMHTQI